MGQLVSPKRSRKMNIADTKFRAREMMSPQMGNLILAYIIYSLIMYGVSTITFGLAWLVVFGPLSLGMAGILLKVDRAETINFEEVFAGFNDFGRSLLAGVLTTLYIFLWSLLFLIPGIIAALSYSMTFFIMKENPQMSAEDAITASKNLMMGHKAELFELFISFIGWWILSMLSFGIALIYATPYYYCALTVFYQTLKHNQSKIS